MPPLSFLIAALLVGVAAVDAIADELSLRNMHAELPEEFAGVHDAAQYRTSLRYQRDKTRAGALRRVILLPLTLAFAFPLGGFERVDEWARGLGRGPIVTGLVFVGTLLAFRLAAGLPFSIHDTFVVEERYGFNRTTPRTFALDLLKGAVVTALLGTPAMAGVQWFFETTGRGGWLYSWLGLTALQLALMFIAPVVLMPLFNRFSPLPEGALKSAIEAYSRKARFELQGVYTMDGSRRSTKANAFFTGFGPLRRLVLFDTLIDKQSVEELTAVVAHEAGHFKRGHILKSTALSIAATAGMLYAFSFFLGNHALFEAFRMRRVSVYGSLVFAGFVASPVMRALSVPTHLLSRRFEYEADAFSARTYGNPGALVSALKKLSRNNMSNLTPHPLKVWLDYTHPPIMDRIRALRALGAPRESRPKEQA